MPKTITSSSVRRALTLRSPKTRKAPDNDKPLTFANAIKSAPTPSNTRERILHAAVTLLNEDGFSSLTQQRVCERAGIRQSHLTYYFPTRNDLLRETAVYGCEALLSDAVAGAMAGDLTLPKIRELLFVVDESDRKFGRLMAALIVASDEDPRIKPWLASFEIENREKLSAMFVSAGANITPADVELLHAAYVGAVILDIGETSLASIERAQRIVHRAFDLVFANQPMPETPRPLRRSKASPGNIKSAARNLHKTK
jgi:AcrR family transcriptional regulator